MIISIHATHTGGDCGFSIAKPFVVISIHATHTGGDQIAYDAMDLYEISIHATHTGGDENPVDNTSSICYFNPRHPYGWRQDYYG